MSGHSNYDPKTGIEKWLDARLPIIRLGVDTLIFPSPRNLNYWWTFGAILAVMLVSQLLTGIVLAMHYVASPDHAFASIQHINRDVNFGWMLQPMHAVGASMMFLAVYIHMFRGIYYGSHKNPREMIWIVGMVIYLLMMATGFMGYVLPWGQMSIWGAIVITNLFSAIPPEAAGTAVTQWLWGGFAVDAPTLNRFFSLHYLLPFVIVAMVALHIWALHIPSNNNPTGISIKTKADTLNFHPYYTVKDAFAIAVFLMVFAFFVFFMPDALGHPDNYIPANPLSTPAHIVPEWYYLPFYAMLRAVPDKLLGVIVMFGAIATLFVLPWLDASKVRSMRYRPLAKLFFIIFVLACLGLGWCGARSPSDLVFATGHNEAGEAVGFTFVWFSRILTAYYYAFFWIILPVLALVEKPKPRPASIEASVLGKSEGEG